MVGNGNDAYSKVYLNDIYPRKKPNALGGRGGYYITNATIRRLDA